MAENHAQTCITSTEVTLLRTGSGSKFDVRGRITRGDGLPFRIQRLSKCFASVK